MRILIICNNASGLLIFRGMLISKLISLGNTVNAIVPVSDESNEITAQEKLNELNCGLYEVKMERRNTNPFEDLILANEYRNVIKENRPDFVITYTIKPNVYGGMICRFMKIPYAANITGLGTAFQNKGLLRTFVTFLNRLSLKKAKTVIFENCDNMQTFLDYGIVKDKQCLLNNGAGVNIDEFEFTSYPENNEIRFLFIGRVMREKGIDELFEAAKRIKREYDNVYFDIVGPYEEDYKRLTDELVAEGIIEYYGYQEDVKPFIRNAHCFVLPSWHEGMANTNLESAAMGRPVITSNIHGCKEAVVENESGFLCEPKNADSLYEQIKRFIELPYEKKAEMGIAARKHMEEVFDKRKVVEATIEKLFEE